MFVFAFIILLLLLVFVNHYIAKRLYSGIKAVLPKTPFWAVLTPIWIFTAIAILGFIRPNMPDSIKNATEVISSYWMANFVYLFFFTLFADLIYLAIRLLNKEIVQKNLYKIISSVTVLIFAVTTVVFGACNAREIDHISYDITINSKTDISDLNIVMLSDLHINRTTSAERISIFISPLPFSYLFVFYFCDLCIIPKSSS